MKLFSILTAAACLLVVSACASTPAPTDERVHVIEADGATDVQPGNIYISQGAAKIFTFGNVESEINENGYFAVRVSGKTCELSALKWAFYGDIDYEFGYRFCWFDADGNPVSGPETFRLRSTIPGDPVRFVGHAPTEEVRNYALILKTADETEFSATSEDSDGEAAEAADDDIKTEILEDAETVEAGDATIPSLPQENVSGDSKDVKVIGISDKDADSVPKAVPVENE